MKSKHIFKILAAVLFITIAGAVLCACSPSGPYGDYGYPPVNSDEFTDFTENPFVETSKAPVSYFSMDVSTASYAVIRNYINKGLTISSSMVKIEEMVNYFKYSYPAPQAGKPLSVSGSIFPCPWNSESLLFSVGLKAKEIELSSVRSNLVFLLDVSGSMDSPDKLGLLQKAFSILADNLNDDDTVSIVTYAGSSGTALDGAKGADRVRIKNIISDLTAGGSTGGAGGIRHAYALAEKHFISGGNNRVILATDGDFNVGISSQSQLENFIIEKRSQSKGVYLSVLGFGLGNLKNNTMDTLAQNGNGTAYYIDSALEAQKVMAEEIGGTLVTVADDVKASVEFNSDKVLSYRLLGYETKMLTAKDWENNAADAGEIGSGHTVTAVYEIKLTQNFNTVSTHADLGNNIAKASVRYKEPYTSEPPQTDTRQVEEIFKLFSSGDMLNQSQFLQNEDLVFISAVVESALLFRNSIYKVDASLAAVIERLRNLPSVLTDVYRSDFLAVLYKCTQNIG